MRKSYFIIIAFALILAIVVGFQALNKSNKNQGSQTQVLSESDAQIPNLEARTNSEGAVEVTVTPKNLSGKEWVFEIALNTHSKELASDLTKTAILLDDKGNEYMPLGWEGDPPSGHHRSGILKFNPVLPQPTLITIKIRQVGGIEERNFTWQLN